MIEIISKNKVVIHNKQIEFECMVEKIIEYEKLYVVMLQYDYYPGNNIIAYDFFGEKQWSIEEIIHFPYSEAYVDLAKAGDCLLDVISYSGVEFVFNVYTKEIVEKRITK